MKKFVVFSICSFLVIPVTATIYTDDIQNLCGAIPFMVADFGMEPRFIDDIQNLCGAIPFMIAETEFGITCGPGFYLAANSTECEVCSLNSYCVGGTYQFNESVAQGIISCPNNWYSPAGMSSIDQCGRILHIGDNVVYLRSVKKTTPSLNIDIDNDGIADFFGNMTTNDVVMNSGTERKLKLQYGGQTYSVYDDSVDVGE